MTSNAHPVVLQVRGLSVAHETEHGPRPALRGIDFDLRAGEIVSVIGESGSGKSTLASTLLGLLPASSQAVGRIRLHDRDLMGLTAREWARVRGSEIALVPQDPGTSLDPLVTIGRQITEVYAIHGVGRGRRDRRRLAVELLERVGVDRPEYRFDQYPHELSGGLKQRVLIAIGFALNPRVLIADEPTSALDVTVQKRVLAVFEDLARESGTSVLFITHDIGVATDHSSRALVIREGRIVDAAAIDDLLLNPGSDYTRLLLDVADASRATPLSAGLGDEVVVEADGLRKTYAGTRRNKEPLVAVDDVSIRVRRGTTLALVGESGSGKTTTGRALLGLVRPDAGRVKVDGIEVDFDDTQALRELWRHVQYVHQSPWLSLDPRLSVRRSLEEPLRGLSESPSSAWPAHIASMLGRVGLPEDILARRPDEISGGQRQRVVLARALLSGARVLVLDEVLSALDVVTQQQILDLLAELQRDLGLTYVLISHDLAVVRAVAHEVVILRRGRVVEAGPTQAVFDEPSAEYTRELLEAIPGRRIAELRGNRTELLA